VCLLKGLEEFRDNSEAGSKPSWDSPYRPESVLDSPVPRLANSPVMVFIDCRCRSPESPGRIDSEEVSGRPAAKRGAPKLSGLSITYPAPKSTKQRFEFSDSSFMSKLAGFKSLCAIPWQWQKWTALTMVAITALA